VAYVLCVIPTTPLANSFEYSWYTATIVCVIYLIGRVILRCGVYWVNRWVGIKSGEEVKQKKAPDCELSASVNPLSTDSEAQLVKEA
jgi:hypothetical protein